MAIDWLQVASLAVAASPLVGVDETSFQRRLIAMARTATRAAT